MSRDDFLGQIMTDVMTVFSVRFQSGLCETQVLEFHEFTRACLPVEVKYAVIFFYNRLIKML